VLASTAIYNICPTFALVQFLGQVIGKMPDNFLVLQGLTLKTSFIIMDRTIIFYLKKRFLGHKF
jgi:hypothetical protein